MDKGEIERLIREDVPEKVLYAVLSAISHSGDGPWSEEICCRLAEHQSPLARGNVMTAQGHIARIHGALKWDAAIEILNRGLEDPDEFVRGSASNGLDDVIHFKRLNTRRPARDARE